MKAWLVIACTWSLSLQAQVSPDKLFSDNMVLQRDRPIRVWGKATPGQSVTVSFAGKSARVLTTKDSTWLIGLPAQPANTLPQDMTITSGPETILLRNILIGDLWLCIGQSNMEFPMKAESHFTAALQDADNNRLRWYNPTYIGKNVYATAFTDSMCRRLNKEDFYQGSWQSSNAANLATMSAIGYYFGRRITKEAGIPIGLIHLAIGGCPLETFADALALSHSPQFAAKASGNWLNNEALPVWPRTRAHEHLGPACLAAMPSAPSTSGPDHAYKTGFAFEAGIRPLLSMPIRGILWYQGESNAQEWDRVKEYKALLKWMIADYRKKWAQPGMPFYWVQLSSIDTLHYRSQYWPEFRDGQRSLLAEVRNGGMAVSSDVGARDNVHPTDKRTVGERLARWALHDVYGKKIMPCGPLPLRADYSSGRIRIRFQYTGDSLQTSDDLPLRGCSIDGKTDAAAVISGKEVIIDHVRVKPAYVYYGWKPYTDANLVNKDRLPASTFKLKIH